MGAFLLIRKPKNVEVEEIEGTYRDSIAVFHKKGLPLNERIVTNDFVIYVFHKHKFQVDNTLLLDDGEFIISTGTCIYDRKIGCDALRKLYRDFSEKGEFLSNVFGQYCLIVSKEGSLYLLNDYTGLYHVYSNHSRSVISSSFLAVAKTLKERNLSIQEFYEYVINGAFYGDKTPIKEIELIGSRYIWQLSPELSAIPKKPNVRRLSANCSFEEIVQKVSSNLVDHFGALKTVFGNNICAALSGGFDTRLMLALMKKVGIRPYLYVYGDESSSDVAIAKLVARGEGLNIEHDDRDKFPKFTEDEFAELLEKQYYARDGLGDEDGIFDNGSDLYTRFKRTEKAELQLNGVGGEIYRNFWLLPDKALYIESFLKSRYDRIGYSIFPSHFKRSHYFSTLASKIRAVLNFGENRIERKQIEMIYPYWRLKYWAGINNSVNNQLTYALAPFTDISLVFQSFDIPLRLKHLGIFEGALIKFIDPDLAKYPSVYGFNFSNGIKLSTKIKYFAKLHTPIFLRPHIRKYFWKKGKKDCFPFYLTSEYLTRIFPSTEASVSKYVHIDKINHPAILSRVLSVELVVTDRF